MLSSAPTYENIVQALLGFVDDCDIMAHGKNTTHSLNDMVEIMATSSVCTASAGGCAAAARKGYEENRPSDEWVRKAFARADPQMVQSAMETTISYQLEKLKKMGLMNGKITVAIDKHLIPRYDKNPGMEIVRSKKKSGTWKFETYITAQCVDKGRRLTLASFPMGMGDSTADFVRKILTVCEKQGVGVRCFLMDREFFSAPVLAEINHAGQNFKVPCKNSPNVVRALDEFDRKVREGTSEVFLEGADATVKYIMVVVKRTARKSKEPDAPPEDRYIGFAANSNEAHVAAYMSRWGIETGYRMIENVRLKTRSTKLGARMLCFAASIIIFNQWVVINAQHGFDSDGEWKGIKFTILTLKALLMSVLKIKPEPPPDVPVTGHVGPPVG